MAERPSQGGALVNLLLRQPSPSKAPFTWQATPTLQYGTAPARGLLLYHDRWPLLHTTPLLLYDTSL